MKYKIWTFTLSALFLLNGCGVSSEDWASKDPSAFAASPNTFDISEAWTKFNFVPNATQMSVSGTCSGAYIISNTAAYFTSPTDLYNVTNFNGQYYLCNTPFGYKNGTIDYANSTYYSYENKRLKNYWYYYQTTGNAWREIAQFPTAAKIGDTGLIGVIDNFTSSDLSTKTGSTEWRYVIEANTATTVVFNLTVTAYGTTTSSTATDYQSAPVIKTEQFRYVVKSDNSMKLRSYDLEEPGGFKITAN
jgi:hypothetical protein